MAKLAESGAAVAHNPLSNLKLGSGIAAVRRMRDAGITVAMGTDGATSSDGLNLFEATRLGCYLSRVQEHGLERWLTAGEAFSAVAQSGARALGFAGKIGRIAPGYHADIVFLDLTAPHYVPLNEPLNQLIFAEDGTGVESVMVGGEMVLDHGRFTRIDYPALIRKAQAAASELREKTASLRHMVGQFEPIVHQFCSGLAARPLSVERLRR